MSNVVNFQPRDVQEREALKKRLCEMIDAGRNLVILLRDDEIDETEVISNLQPSPVSRLYLQGLLVDVINQISLDYAFGGEMEEE
jgi:hypothetical protein